MKTGITLFLLFALVIACKDDTAMDMDMCDTIEGATFTSDNGQMRSILQTKCGISGCHVPGGDGAAFWTFDPDYSALQGQFNNMYVAVSSGVMPPAGAADLTNAERDLFDCWQEAGFPE